MAIKAGQILAEGRVSVYALCDPETGEVRYVGKAVDPRARLRGHLWECDHSVRGRTHRGAWLRSLRGRGMQPSLRILEVVAEDQWQEAERRWIAAMRSEGRRLTNGTDGGEGGAMSPEITAIAAEKRRGRRISDETRAKMSSSHRARLVSPEAREVHRQAAIQSQRRPPLPSKGLDNVEATLSDEEVVKLRKLSVSGRCFRELAEIFNITPTGAWYIATGRTRKDAGGPVRLRQSRQRLSDADVREIRSLHSNNVRNKDIAQMFGVDPSHVSKIISGAARNAA